MNRKASIDENGNPDPASMVQQTYVEEPTTIEEVTEHAGGSEETETALQYSSSGSGPYFATFGGKRGLMGCFRRSQVSVRLEGTSLLVDEGRVVRMLEICGAVVDRKRNRIRISKPGVDGLMRVEVVLHAQDSKMAVVWEKLLVRASRSVSELHYLDGPLIGAGGYGKVLAATDGHRGQSVAIKILDNPRWSQVVRRYMEAEVSVAVAVKVRHSNIVQFLDVFETLTEKRIVMEMMEGGSLGDLLRRLQGERELLPEGTVKSLMRDLLSGVAHLHGLGIVHRDLKPDNCLLSKAGAPYGSLKIADFGMAHLGGYGKKRGVVCSSAVGTEIYMAPDVHRGSYGAEVDLWSCGVIMYVILSGGKAPFCGSTPSDYARNAMWREPEMSCARLPLASRSAKDLITGLLRPDPSDRLTAEQALSHPWFVGDS